MKVSQIEKAIAQFEAEIAILQAEIAISQKCIAQLRVQQLPRGYKVTLARKAKTAEKEPTL